MLLGALELPEAVARLGAAKYADVPGMRLVESTAGALDNLLGIRSAEQVIADAQPRLVPPAYRPGTQLATYNPNPTLPQLIPLPLTLPLTSNPNPNPVQARSSRRGRARRRGRCRRGCTAGRRWARAWPSYTATRCGRHACYLARVRGRARARVRPSCMATRYGRHAFYLARGRGRARVVLGRAAWLPATGGTPTPNPNPYLA